MMGWSEGRPGLEALLTCKVVCVRGWAALEAGLLFGLVWKLGCAVLFCALFGHWKGSACVWLSMG
jgi:hypothetical protein